MTFVLESPGMVKPDSMCERKITLEPRAETELRCMIRTHPLTIRLLEWEGSFIA